MSHAVGAIPAAALAIAVISWALLGGSARPDVPYLIFLRPITVLCLMAILLSRSDIEWGRVKTPMILLGMFALVMVLQLIPLPPALWQSFGGPPRFSPAMVAQGESLPWRPLSVTPDGTWNSLVALLVPATMLTGYAALSERQRRFLLPALLLLVIASAVFGVAQVASGKYSPLYYYRFMHLGLPDGFFANRNHHAALLATSLPMLRVWTLLPTRHQGAARSRNALALCVGALILLVGLVTGSRSGLAMMLVGLLGAFFVRPQLPGARLPAKYRVAIVAAIILCIVAVVAVALLNERAIAIDRLMGIDIEEKENRIRTLPVLIDVIRQTFPFGTGFGSFVPVYQMYEPDSLLDFSYLNNAHNDLIELTITGGILALLVLLSLVIWWARASFLAFFRASEFSADTALRRAAVFGIAILFLASMTDYPLRTPLMSGVFALFCAWLADRSGSFHHRHGHSA